MSQSSAGKGARALHPFPVIHSSSHSTRSWRTWERSHEVSQHLLHGRALARQITPECNLPPHVLDEIRSPPLLNPPWRCAHSSRLTWTCCFCAFSMFGSMERGPSTLIISSFSMSQGRSWASAAWKLASWFADSSSFCCRSAVAWLALSHLQSEAPAVLAVVTPPASPPLHREGFLPSPWFPRWETSSAFQ